MRFSRNRKPDIDQVYVGTLTKLEATIDPNLPVREGDRIMMWTEWRIGAGGAVSLVSMSIDKEEA